MTSCATIMNRPHQYITIYTTEPCKVIHKRDTLTTTNGKAHLLVERKNEALKIMAVTDSLTKTFTVEPRNSFMYWGNLYFCGIGMLIDKDNPKRYSYPQTISLNPSGTISRFYRYKQAINKGELRLHLSLPHINSFRMAPEGERLKINTGFWGVAIGLDYYHSKNQFVNLGIGGVTDIIFPIPGAVDRWGVYEQMISKYISLSNNHKLGYFTTGYGLSFAKNTWNLTYEGDSAKTIPDRESVKKSSLAWGLVFPTYFQLGEHFHIGVVYRPTFYRPKMADKFVYEYVISLDCAWKIRLGK